MLRRIRRLAPLGGLPLFLLLLLDLSPPLPEGAVRSPGQVVSPFIDMRSGAELHDQEGRRRERARQISVAVLARPKRPRHVPERHVPVYYAGSLRAAAQGSPNPSTAYAPDQLAGYLGPEQQRGIYVVPAELRSH